MKKERALLDKLRVFLMPKREDFDLKLKKKNIIKIGQEINKEKS